MIGWIAWALYLAGAGQRAGYSWALRDEYRAKPLILMDAVFWFVTGFVPGLTWNRIFLKRRGG